MRVVIGCGNLNRSDDAAGVLVVRRLRARCGAALPGDVRLFDAGTGGVEVMFQARGARSLIVVDACRSGSEPGAIFRLPGAEVDGAYEPGYSLHDFRWEHALHAGRRLFGADFPADVEVYLIEAGSLALGTEPGAAVQAAVERVASLIAERLGLEA